MLLLRQKTLDQKITDAVTAALGTMDAAYASDLSTLRYEIATLRADLDGRDAELTHAMEKRLVAERQRQDAGVTGLLLSVKAVQEDLQQVRSLPAIEVPDLSPRITAVSREAREASDLATYLLDSPIHTERVVEMGGQSTMAAFNNAGTIRPMGVR